MIREIFPNLFREQIPLPQNPLKATNSYVIKGNGRFLMIDTGMNRPECRQAMDAYIREIKMDLTKTDFFITHLHADHLGLVSELACDSSTIYFNRPDHAEFHDPHHWDRITETALLNGFPERDLSEAVSRHPGKRFPARRPLRATLLGEGDRIEIGDYAFTCIETPGHTPGHLCLYEPRLKIFISGDHLLESITPNISLWSEGNDPLKQYLESLDKVSGYDVEQVLPGHREPFTHFRRRIGELKKHHQIRNEEILSILKRGKQTAYEVASMMSWDIDCRSWEEFPLSQKWFASGEALAHLQYLKGAGMIEREFRSGIAVYFLMR